MGFIIRLIDHTVDVIEHDPEYVAQSKEQERRPGSAATLIKNIEAVSNMLPSTPSLASVDPELEAKRRAFVRITEQPASKALRFRYECEGRSAGSIPGAKSSVDVKSFPSIQVGILINFH